MARSSQRSLSTCEPTEHQTPEGIYLNNTRQERHLLLSLALQPTVGFSLLSDFILLYYMLIICCGAANYITVILDNSLVFRVMIPDAVLIQFDLLRMSKILLET